MQESWITNSIPPCQTLHQREYQVVSGEISKLLVSSPELNYKAMLTQSLVRLISWTGDLIQRPHNNQMEN